MKKIYTAFVVGSWPKKVRTVQLKLKRYETSWGERRVRVDSHGQQARTDFAIVEQAGVLATRLQATLHTGRTHQIRVHTSASGHAIIGDDKYLDRNDASPWAQTNLPAPGRLCLHASKLTIPLQEGALRVSAPPGEDLETIWRQLLAAAEG